MLTVNLYSIELNNPQTDTANFVTVRAGFNYEDDLSVNIVFKMDDIEDEIKSIERKIEARVKKFNPNG